MAETHNNEQAQRPKTSKLAVASFVLAILSILSIFVFLHALASKFPANIAVLIFLISASVAILLGFASIFTIWQAKGRLQGMGFVIGGIVIPTIFIVWTNPLAELTRAYPLECGCNIEALGAAMLVYANQFQDNYPMPDKWCDSLMQLGCVSAKQFLCPASRAKKGQSSYALNKNIVGTKRSDIPGDVVLLFESKPGWNQVGGPEILTTENHKGKGCLILFNDGHARFVITQELGKLQWKVQQTE